VMAKWCSAAGEGDLPDQLLDVGVVLDQIESYRHYSGTQNVTLCFAPLESEEAMDVELGSLFHPPLGPSVRTDDQEWMLVKFWLYLITNMPERGTLLWLCLYCSVPVPFRGAYVVLQAFDPKKRVKVEGVEITLPVDERLSWMVGGKTPREIRYQHKICVPLPTTLSDTHKCFQVLFRHPTYGVELNLGGFWDVSTVSQRPRKWDQLKVLFPQHATAIDHCIGHDPRKRHFLNRKGDTSIKTPPVFYLDECAKAVELGTVAIQRSIVRTCYPHLPL